MAAFVEVGGRPSAPEPIPAIWWPAALDDVAPRRARRRTGRPREPMETRCRAGGGSAAIAPHPEPRRIVMLVYPGICLLDAAGPLDAFAMANDLAALSGARQVLYDLAIAAASVAPIPTSVGLHDHPDVHDRRAEASRRHAPSVGRRRPERRQPERASARVSASRVAADASLWIDLHRRVPARGGGIAGGTAGHDALGPCGGTPAILPDRVGRPPTASSRETAMSTPPRAFSPASIWPWP